MKAITQDTCGSTDVLELRDIPDPRAARTGTADTKLTRNQQVEDLPLVGVWAATATGGCADLRLTPKELAEATVIAPRPGDGTVAAGRMVRSVATAPVDHSSYCRCMRFEATIDIAARVEHVFAVYTDVEHWPDWTRSVTSVERLDPGPLRVGSRARIRQPRLPVAVWEVTDLASGRSFTWMARGPGIVTTGKPCDQACGRRGPGHSDGLTGARRRAGPAGRSTDQAADQPLSRHGSQRPEGSL